MLTDATTPLAKNTAPDFCDATAKADAANAALATAYGKFTAAQTAELAKWAADSSAFATVAAGAIIAAAALF